MGFMVTEPLELLNWQRITVEESMPPEVQPACPSCGQLLTEFVRLAAADGHRAIRVGACYHCAYLGYLDRPTREWISRYYDRVWSHGAEKDTEALAAKKQKSNPARSAIERALAMLPDPRAAIVEIGSGYGTMLKFIRANGFLNLIGIESSRRRAEAATRATGFPILSGDFEAPAIQSELARRAPIRLLLAFHVLEHTYHPGEVLAACARLQKSGDLLVLGVPNVWGEPAMNILLFLPHLHSFSASSLAQLINRSGYEVVDSSFSNQAEVILIAKRTTMLVDSRTPARDYGSDLTIKFRRELCLDQPLDAGRTYRYFWSKDTATVFGLKPYHWYWRIQDRLAGRSGCRSLLVEPLADDVSIADLPFRVQFARNLFLCIK